MAQPLATALVALVERWRRQRAGYTEEPQRRTTRAITKPEIQNAYWQVCPESSQMIANFSQEFHKYGGLKNRRLGASKMWIRQVLISRTLGVCGEVAERLKAAIC